MKLFDRKSHGLDLAQGPLFADPWWSGFLENKAETPLASVDDGEKNLVLGIKRLSWGLASMMGKMLLNLFFHNFSVDITKKKLLWGKKMAPRPTTLNTTVFSSLYISFKSWPLIICVLSQSPDVCTYQLLAHWDLLKPNRYKLDLAETVFLRTRGWGALPFSVFLTFSVKGYHSL